MDQKVIGYHQDDEKHWVADLACGHKQHVRHDPPLTERRWVTTEEGRKSRLGSVLNCKRCDEVGEVVARALQKVALNVVQEAYEDAASAGMCKEGQLELIQDRIKSLDLKSISQKAISDATTELGTLS